MKITLGRLAAVAGVPPQRQLKTSARIGEGSFIDEAGDRSCGIVPTLRGPKSLGFFNGDALPQGLSICTSVDQASEGAGQGGDQSDGRRTRTQSNTGCMGSC